MIAMLRPAEESYSARFLQGNRPVLDEFYRKLLCGRYIVAVRKISTFPICY